MLLFIYPYTYEYKIAKTLYQRKIECLFEDLPAMYRGAVCLLDAAADSEGRACIEGIGQRAAYSNCVEYDLEVRK